MPPLSAQTKQLIVGGEAALWTEIVNEQSIDLRLWPRAFVVAERLWSAQRLQDENAMYLRKKTIADWSEKSLGLLHRAQTESALERLFGERHLSAVKTFIELLQPAYYYHRQHEKSAFESYSKADPLNRLADALPVENERLRQFDLQLTQWLKHPDNGEVYRTLDAELQRWLDNQQQLKLVVTGQPGFETLVGKTTSAILLTRQLLQLALERKTLPATEKAHLENQLLACSQIEQEMIIALVFSAQKILDSL